MRSDEPLPQRSELRSSPFGDEPEKPLVMIVDDDASIREALAELITSAGLQPACFASARELVDADVLGRPGCLILDVRMPGASGLDLQKHLTRNGNLRPIIFLTGHGDIPMTVEAMKAGAVDFLTKPVRDQTLLDAVIEGIAVDVERREKAAVVTRHVKRLETLTSREREVLHEVARGRLNKQIAFDLGISEVTVKLHRANIMRKMEATSIGELIRAWETLPAPVRDADTGAVRNRYPEAAITAVVGLGAPSGGVFRQADRFWTGERGSGSSELLSTGRLSARGGAGAPRPDVARRAST